MRNSCFFTYFNALDKIQKKEGKEMFIWKVVQIKWHCLTDKRLLLIFNFFLDYFFNTFIVCTALSVWHLFLSQKIIFRFITPPPTVSVTEKHLIFEYLNFWWKRYILHFICLIAQHIQFQMLTCSLSQVNISVECR